MPTTAISRALDPQRCAAALVFVARLVGRLPGNGEPGGRAEVAHRIVGVGVTRANSAVLVCVGGDIGDELLRRQREEPREALVGLRRRREAGASHVVIRDGVGDLFSLAGGFVSIASFRVSARFCEVTYYRRVVVHLVEKLLERRIFARRQLGLVGGWRRCAGISGGSHLARRL